MKTLKKIPVKVEFFEGNRPDWDDMELGTFYVTKRDSSAYAVCLCGCKTKVVMTLNINENGVELPSIWPSDNWKLIIKDDKVTITPSILNPECPLKYHYIITNSIANIV